MRKTIPVFTNPDHCPVLKANALTRMLERLHNLITSVEILTVISDYHILMVLFPLLLYRGVYSSSGIEDSGTILSHIQCPMEASSFSERVLPKIELNTENIFAPKTKDMDKECIIPPEMRSSICKCSTHLSFYLIFSFVCRNRLQHASRDRVLLFVNALHHIITSWVKLVCWSILLNF